jgi:hypothetical protein
MRADIARVAREKFVARRLAVAREVKMLGDADPQAIRVARLAAGVAIGGDRGRELFRRQRDVAERERLSLLACADRTRRRAAGADPDRNRLRGPWSDVRTVDG